MAILTTQLVKNRDFFYFPRPNWIAEDIKMYARRASNIFLTSKNDIERKACKNEAKIYADTFG